MFLIFLSHMLLVTAGASSTVTYVKNILGTSLLKVSASTDPFALIHIWLNDSYIQ